MPHSIINTKTCAHRTAGIALFRCLLKKCANVPLDAQKVASLQNVVRNRFKAHHDNASRRLLTRAFNAGYEGVDLLSAAASGDQASLQRVEAILEHVKPQYKRTPRPSIPMQRVTSLAKRAAIREARSKLGAAVKTTPSASERLLSRPHPLSSLSGRRRVPKFVDANGFPFLRIKKPQPINLTFSIAKYIKDRHRSIVMRDQLNNVVIPLALQEDIWDDLLLKEYGRDQLLRKGTDKSCVVPGSVDMDTGRIESYNKWNASWSNVAAFGAREMRIAIGKDREDKMERARRLWEIVDKEKALAEQEEQQRKRLRREQNSKQREGGLAESAAGDSTNMEDTRAQHVIH